jgi:hypothetical protein
MPNKLQSPVFWPVEERITASEVDTAAALAAATDGLGVVANAVAATATSDGLTTGIVPDTADFVVVTSANANNIITLPTPTPGRFVRLRNAGTGYELRTTSPTTVAINGGTGSAAESAIGANVLVLCVCDTATTWICTQNATAGTASVSEVAAP